MSAEPALVASALRETWSSPSGILTIVLIIGGDVVQKALAQTTGATAIPTPVCFSFGWVAYAFTTHVMMWGSAPVDLLATRFMCFILALLWIGLLICVTALADDAWYLMAVGALGMMQNAIIAGVDFKSERYGIHLEHVKTCGGRKVMDSLKEFEDAYPGNGKALVDEFFPGGLRSDEEEWWTEAEVKYKEMKRKEKEQQQKDAEEKKVVVT